MINSVRARLTIWYVTVLALLLAALISLLAIPLSLLAAALVIHYQGYTINTMVIAGLVIALGAVVDDAIIDVENIMRRLRLNHASEHPEPAFQVVLKASLELRRVGEAYEEQKIFDVVVWGSPHIRNDIESIRQIRINLPAGGDVPLGEVAEVRIAPTPNVIQRENASRRIDVTCDVKGRDLGSVAREIETRVKALPFDRGYHPEFLGEYAARQESQNRLLALSGLSILGILLLLHADFRLPRLVALVFISLPFALVGGVILGGLVTSILLNLFLMPTLYLRFGKSKNVVYLEQINSTKLNKLDQE